MMSSTLRVQRDTCVAKSCGTAAILDPPASGTQKGASKRPRVAMSIASAPLHNLPTAIEGLSVLELKKTLRGCGVDPARVLESQTKAELLELATMNGIGPQVPDEWMMQKMKTAAAKKRGAAKVSPRSRRAPASARPGSAAKEASAGGDSPKQPTGSPGDQQTDGEPLPSKRSSSPKQKRQPAHKAGKRIAAKGGKLPATSRGSLNAGTGSPSSSSSIAELLPEPAASDRRSVEETSPEPEPSKSIWGLPFQLPWERREPSPDAVREAAPAPAPAPASDVSRMSTGTSAATLSRSNSSSTLGLNTLDRAKYDMMNRAKAEAALKSVLAEAQAEREGRESPDKLAKAAAAAKAAEETKARAEEPLKVLNARVERTVKEAQAIDEATSKLEAENAMLKAQLRKEKERQATKEAKASTARPKSETAGRAKASTARVKSDGETTGRTKPAADPTALAKAETAKARAKVEEMKAALKAVTPPPMVVRGAPPTKLKSSRSSLASSGKAKTKATSSSPSAASLSLGTSAASTAGATDVSSPLASSAATAATVAASPASSLSAPLQAVPPNSKSVGVAGTEPGSNGGKVLSSQTHDEGRPVQLFEIGTAVYIPRSNGGESVAYVVEYQSPREDWKASGAKGVYKVELEERNSGRFKLATEDFLSAEPKGLATIAPVGFRVV